MKKSVKQMNVMELCEIYEQTTDKELKRDLNQLISAKLATNSHQEKALLQAMNEPLRNNKGLKKGKTKFEYVSR